MWVAIVGVLGVLAASPAAAQELPDRITVTFTPGFRVTSTSASESITFEAYSEQGSLTAKYTAERGPTFDGGVTVRVWPRVAVAVIGSYLHQTPAAEVNALVPHPFEVNQPRAISGAPEVTHNELALHIDAVYWLRHTRQLDILLSGGPSIIRTEQDFVSDVTYTQTDPYDTAAYEGATLVRDRATSVGGNVGIEAGWNVASHVGIAAVARYSRATADFTSSGAPALAVGGLHLGAGIRLLF
jgi:hypothetical protein